MKLANRSLSGSWELDRLAELLTRVRVRIVIENVDAGHPPTSPAELQLSEGSESSRSPKLLLRIEEVAEMLGIGRSKIYELLRSGELPSVRIGRSVRISVDDLRAWVRTRRQ